MAPPPPGAQDRIDHLETVVAGLEAQIGHLSRALAVVRSELEELRCPAGRDHAHSPAGGCICPVCGLVLPAGLRVEYRLRHLRGLHERCPDCGDLFVGLRVHWSKAHRAGPFLSFEEAALAREVAARRASAAAFLHFVKEPDGHEAL